MGKSIMKILSEELKGEFIARKYDEQEKVKVAIEGFEIVFDYYVHYNQSHQKIFTRIILPFSSQNDLNFEIYPQTILSKFAKAIKFIRDIEIGRKDFDSKFIIKSNNEFKIKSFLNDSKVRELINNKKKFKFSISKDKGIWGNKLPENQYELSYFANGTITEMNQFRSILELFIVSLNQLIEINDIKPELYILKYK